MSYTQHYLFAHRILPALLATEPDKVANLLSDSVGLLGLWKETPGKRFHPDGLAGEWVEREAHRIGLITLPSPRKTPEAYFVAIVFAPQPRYFVLEKSFHGTILGLWNPRANLGTGPPPEREAFLAAVCEFLAQPQTLTSIGVDFGQLNLAAGELNRYLDASSEKPITVTPEKLASFHCFLLHCSRPIWQPHVFRAARASWWSFFFRRKVADLFACCTLKMMQGQIEDPVAATKFTMGAVMAAKHAFPRGNRAWESPEEATDPTRLAAEMAELLKRPSCAPALEAALAYQMGLLKNRLLAVVIFCEGALTPDV